MHHPRFGAASLKAVLLTALLVTLAVVVAGVSAQDEARRHGIFLDSLDVSLVNLEVLVTTPDGVTVRRSGVSPDAPAREGRHCPSSSGKRPQPPEVRAIPPHENSVMSLRTGLSRPWQRSESVCGRRDVS